MISYSASTWCRYRSIYGTVKLYFFFNSKIYIPQLTKQLSFSRQNLISNTNTKKNKRQSVSRHQNFNLIEDLVATRLAFILLYHYPTFILPHHYPTFILPIFNLCVHQKQVHVQTPQQKTNPHKHDQRSWEQPSPDSSRLQQQKDSYNWNVLIIKTWLTWTIIQNFLNIDRRPRNFWYGFWWKNSHT